MSVDDSPSSEILLDLSRQQRNLLLFRPLVQLELSKNMFGDGAEGSKLFDGIEMAEALSPGWEYITSLPVAVPTAQRAAFNSVTGFVRLALGNMTQNGLLLGEA